MNDIPYSTHDIAVSVWYYAGIRRRVRFVFKQEDMVSEHLVGEILYATKSGCGLRTGQFDFPYAYHLVKSYHSDNDPRADDNFVDFFFGLCDLLLEGDENEAQ